MTETDVECILVRAHEAHPNERPRIISDNGPQFIAKDFKEFIRLTGMTHVRTAPCHGTRSCQFALRGVGRRPIAKSRRLLSVSAPLGVRMTDNPADAATDGRPSTYALSAAP